MANDEDFSEKLGQQMKLPERVPLRGQQQMKLHQRVREPHLRGAGACRRAGLALFSLKSALNGYVFLCFLSLMETMD